MAVGDFWRIMREALGHFSWRPRPARHATDLRRNALFAEVLERRELLSVNQIFFDAANENVSIIGTNDADQVTVSYDSATVLRVRAQSADGLVERTFQTSAVSSISFRGYNGDDRFENFTSIASTASGDEGDDHLSGGSGDDSLFGGAGNDLLLGGSGNDQLFGDDGSDTLLGGSGKDAIYGGAGDDRLEGQAGDDSLLGDAGNDTLLGSDGNDDLMGQVGDDVLDGGIGDDRLWGDDGDDQMLGGSGADQLFGGAGNDSLVGGDGDDAMYGDAGHDWLDGQAGNDSLHGGGGDDTLHGGIGDDDLIGHEGNDRLYGGDGNDRIWGLSGNDILEGGAGADQLFGGDDNDILRGGDGIDSLYGEAGKDWLLGELGDDQLYGGDDSDTLDGGIGNDDLNGGSGNDLIAGGDGNDRLWGERGIDRLYGGGGDDQLFGGDDNDVLDGGAGADALYGEAGNDWLIGGSGNDSLAGGDGKDTLDGGVGADVLKGDAGIDTLFGGDGNDLLWGFGDNDRLEGGAGDDQLFGGDGNDVLIGGDGDDFIYGEAGDDTALGGNGNDRIEGGSGQDSLSGGNGNDYLIGDEGNNLLFGEDGDDELVGSGETDYLFGGSGNDRLGVSSGQHVLVGGTGDDRLTGLGGADVLIGGAGKDELYGYGGDDLLIGGSTSYDTSVSHLSTLFAAWARIAPYEDRVSQVASETFGTSLRSNQTVFDDQVADQIYGNEGQDWFFLPGVAEVYDPNLGIDGDVPGASHDGGSHGTVIVNRPPVLEGFDFIDSLDKIADRQPGESLHTLIAYADDPVLQRERLTVTQLVRYDQVTHFAVTSGAWSNPSTWHDGIVPSNGARVLIPVGVEVTVNRVETARLATIRVDGTLKFSRTANTELRVDTVVVTSVGRFEMGTATAPIPAQFSAKLIFTDNGPIDRAADPFALGRGLVSDGSVSMYGAVVTASGALANVATAGTSWLYLRISPIGWKVGDSIVVASSTPGAEQNEVRTIAAIYGYVLVLDRPLTYNHLPSTPDGQIHVANVTRNVSISSEATAADRRGHVMFMHNRDVHIANAGFYKLGRTDKMQPINDSVVDANWQLKPGTGTNQRARYPVHFHRNGFLEDGNPATITGSAVSDSPGWGFVNHSSYVDMVGNVAFNLHGAAFATEVGDEIGSFVDNIALGTVGSGEVTESRIGIQDFGHQGDGFWFQGTGIRVIGNVAAGNDGSAFMVFAQGLIEGGVRQKFLAANLPDPSIAGGAAEIDISYVPMLAFANNTGYASGTGLSVWYHLRNAAHGVDGVFGNSLFWNNSHGVDMSYSQNTILRNLKIVRPPDLEPWLAPHIGVDGNLVTRDITYENLTVTGYYHGVVVPRSGATTIIGGKFQNYNDFLILTGIDAGRTVYFTGNLQVNRIIMEEYFTYPTGNTNFVFLQDRVTLNFGPYRNQRLYYNSQAPNAVPFPAAVNGVPSTYVGLNSQNLWLIHRVAVGGTVAPAVTFTVPSIVGLIGPAI